MTYRVCFFVSLADYSKYAADSIGAYFSKGAVNLPGTSTTLGFTPAVVNTSGPITTTTGWTAICGTFTSGTGGEDHLIIGNFADDAHTTLVDVGGHRDMSYYYIDDVCVTPDGYCPPPVFTTQPQSQTPAFCDSITLNSPALGGCPIQYQWFISCSGSAGSPLSETPGWFTGVTSPTLSLSSQAVAAYSGCSFYVTATNDCGTATSDPATVTLSPAPTVSPGTLSVCPPEPASLTVNFPGSGYKYTWYQRPAGSGRTGNVIPNATGPTLDGNAPAYWRPHPDDCGDEIYCEIYKPGCGYASSNPVLIECCPCTTPPASMALWLPFDQVSGSPALTRNVVAYGASGILMPMGSGPSLYPKSHVGNALFFDGADDHVLVVNHGLIDVDTGDLSIDAWIFIEGTTGPRYVIVDKMTTGPGAAQGYRLSAYGTSNGLYVLELTLGDGGAPVTWTAVGASAAFDNRWHHVAVTLDRTSTLKRGRFYVDGVQVAVIDPSTVSGSLSNTAPLLVGARNAAVPADCFWGAIDEVEVFPRVLSPLEVKAIYEASGIGKCKQFAEIITPAIFCGDSPSTTVAASVFNFTPNPYTLAGTFTTNAACVLLPIPNFPLPVTLPVAAYGFNSVSVTANRPGGMSIFDQTCYDASFTAPGFNASAFGKIIYRPDIACGGWDAAMKTVPVNQFTEATLGFGNLAMASDLFTVRIEAIGPDGQPSRTLSINDAPPGTVLEEVALVPRGGEYQQTLLVRFADADALGLTTLVLSTDADHDGTFEPASVLPLLCTIPGPPEPCPADFDGSGFVDLEDFGDFIQAFEAGTDNADFDHSAFVDTDDFTAFTLAFEAGC